MLTDAEIRTAISDGLMGIDPLDDALLLGASYDMRVGAEAYVSGSDEVVDISNKGLVIVDPGEFAMITTLERIRCGPQVAGQIGLMSDFARQGLVLLSGPQIDPGFEGIWIVRVTNLAPRRVTLPYKAPFLTVQLFKLAEPVEHPYTGSRQGQTGLRPKDLHELHDPESPTLGGMVKSLASLAKDVGDLKSAVKWMGVAVPAIVALGIAVIGIIVGLK